MVIRAIFSLGLLKCFSIWRPYEPKAKHAFMKSRGGEHLLIFRSTKLDLLFGILTVGRLFFPCVFVFVRGRGRAGSLFFQLSPLSTNLRFFFAIRCFDQVFDLLFFN